MFRTIALAAIVAFAPMSAAVTPAVAAAPASSPQADIAAIGRYTAVNQQVLTDVTALISVTIQGMQQGLQYGMSRSSRDEARVWGDSWEADVRQRVAKLKAWRTQLPPLPRAEIGRQAPTTLSMYERMPARVDVMVDAIVGFVESVIPPTRRAAAGDQAAGETLAAEFFRGSGLVLKAENEILDLTAAGLPQGNPGKSLAGSMLASNEAIGLYLDYMAAMSRAEDLDRAALAAGIRAKAARAAAQARAVTADARAAKAQVNASPAFAGKARLIAMMDTYEESAVVELEIAATAAALAEPVEKGVFATSEASAKLAAVQPLIDRRLAIHARRLALLQP